MNLQLEEKEFKQHFNKLLKGLIEGEDFIDWFSVNKKEKSINLLIGDWSVELYNDGTWSIG